MAMIEAIIDALRKADVSFEAVQSNGNGSQSVKSGCPFPDAHSTPGTRDIVWRVEADGTMAVHHFSEGCTKAAVLEALGLDPGAFQRRPTRIIPPPDEPVRVARAFAAAHYGGEPPRLAHWRGDFYAWSGGCWEILPDADIRGRAGTWLDHAVFTATKKDGTPVTIPWKPNSRSLADVVTMLADVVAQVPTAVEEGDWIAHEGDRWRQGTRRHAYLAIAGLTDAVLLLPSRETLSPTPELFALSALPFSRDAHNAKSRVPTRAWNGFLESAFDGDGEAIELVQEWFGYVISGLTSMQKMLLIVGPVRSGKGIMARILGALVGPRHTAAPTMASLASQFGLAPLIGKRLAVVGDARSAGRDVPVVVERLLMISGEDPIDVDRKFKPVWTGRLGVRFMLLSNELPRFGDVSGAIATRFLGPLKTRVSWLGREDSSLEGRLMQELPGIFEWSLDGLDRLLAQGRFTLPDSSRAAAQDLLESASPHKAFVRDLGCGIGPEFEWVASEAFSTWQEWCQENGREHPGDTQRFGGALGAAFGTTTGQRGTGPHKVRVYRGIGPPGSAAEDHPPATAPAGRDVHPVTSRSVTGTPRYSTEYTMIRSPAELDAVLPAILAAEAVGFDLETTGLDPFASEIRTAQLAIPDTCYVIDMAQVHVGALQQVLDGPRRIVGHNLKFEFRHLLAAGLRLPDDIGNRVTDTMLASHLLSAGHRDVHHGLGEVAERLLGVRLDKAEQLGDWSGPLTESQLRYAAADAAVLLPLRSKLHSELSGARLLRVNLIESRALPFIAWMEHAGFGFDRAEQGRLLAQVQERRKAAEMALHTAAGRGINWSSPKQVLGVFRERGMELSSTAAEVLSMVEDPLARELLEYRGLAKLEGLYGASFAQRVSSLTGRIHADFRQMGADPGRMSCTHPNLQQVPKSGGYRRLFVPEHGNRLLKADYSQIELRIAAQLARDPKLIEAYQQGADLHRLTAQQVLRVENPSDADRSRAKALNFGLLYGMGAPGLKRYARTSYGVDMTEVEAKEYRDRFFATYSGLRRWHRSQPNHPIASRTLAGRRRLGVTKFTEKLNTPVQGTGADGLKAAMGLMFERRSKAPGAFPVAVVHDEIVVEYPAGGREGAELWARAAMIEGMASLLDCVPVAVEVEADLECWK
jgi:DNA polymerase I